MTLNAVKSIVCVLALACSIWLGGCRISSPEPDSVVTLRVLTYNIHHGQGTDERFDYERLARIIRGLSPDIVALQEVDRKTERASGIDQAARLAELCQMHYVYGQAMPFQNGQYGQAILSRFPIAKTIVHTLPQRLGREPRVAVEAHMVVEGIGPLVFVGNAPMSPGQRGANGAGPAAGRTVAQPRRAPDYPGGRFQRAAGAAIR